MPAKDTPAPSPLPYAYNNHEIVSYKNLTWGNLLNKIFSDRLGAAGQAPHFSANYYLR
jgi:hypothetical protein